MQSKVFDKAISTKKGIQKLGSKIMRKSNLALHTESSRDNIQGSLMECNDFEIGELPVPTSELPAGLSATELPTFVYPGEFPANEDWIHELFSTTTSHELADTPSPTELEAPNVGAAFSGKSIRSLDSSSNVSSNQPIDAASGYLTECVTGCGLHHNMECSSSDSDHSWDSWDLVSQGSPISPISSHSGDGRFTSDTTTRLHLTNFGSHEASNPVSPVDRDENRSTIIGGDEALPGPEVFNQRAGTDVIESSGSDSYRSAIIQDVHTVPKRRPLTVEQLERVAAAKHSHPILVECTRGKAQTDDAQPREEAIQRSLSWIEDFRTANKSTYPISQAGILMLGGMLSANHATLKAKLHQGIFLAHCDNLSDVQYVHIIKEAVTEPLKLEHRLDWLFSVVADTEERLDTGTLATLNDVAVDLIYGAQVRLPFVLVRPKDPNNG